MKKNNNSKTEIIRENKILEFKNPEEIIFPQICVVCGKNTTNYSFRSFFGTLYSEDRKKTDYKIKFPLCKKCKIKASPKKLNSIHLCLLFSIPIFFGIFFGILIYMYSRAILMSIFVFILILTGWYLVFRKLRELKFDLDELFEVSANSNEKTVVFKIHNGTFRDYIYKINSGEEN